MSRKLRWILPIKRYGAYCRFMKTVSEALGFEASEIAKFRLRCLQILEQQGYAGVRLAFPDVSRRSVFRWQKTYRDSGKRLTSLRPKSTRPKKVNRMMVPAEMLGIIKQWRQQYAHLSKYKLKVFLDAWCDEKGLEKHSVSWVGKVLTRYQLFFGTRKPVRCRRAKPRSGYRIYRCPQVSRLSVGYLQLDGVKVCWDGDTYHFLCAIEVKTRQAWVSKCKSINSLNARVLLETVLRAVPYRIHTIHTDNGGEFKAHFDQAVQDLQLTHLWSPPRTPKVHAHMERFNRTLQEEFVNYNLDLAVSQPEEFEAELSKWLDFYNTKRPHQSLNYMTPQQYLLQLQTQDPQSAKCV